mgnify:CR=1 FL=1
MCYKKHELGFLQKIHGTKIFPLAYLCEFSISSHGDILSFSVASLSTCDTSIIMFCEMSMKIPKSNGIFPIVPIVRDPSTSECERVKRNKRGYWLCINDKSKGYKNMLKIGVNLNGLDTYTFTTL